ncbi:hypothetical protein HK099_003045 [Clydaea vesicula]|uniref:Uncharacterized protein n=1 Tax=Clydaea vesicula TaxID=447962 RepID=A0AAD5TUU5_9FUNG|nr:hypothetical protein HK099_003045 [Clydaea vesicula]
MKESAKTSGIFLASWLCSREWKIKDLNDARVSSDERAAKATELISYLDCFLEWSAVYFKEFTSWFFKTFRSIDSAVRLVKKTKKRESKKLKIKELRELLLEEEKISQNSMEQLLQHLSKFYQQSLAVSNYKMTMEDFKSSISNTTAATAETTTPCLSCNACLNDKPCNSLTQLSNSSNGTSSTSIENPLTRLISNESLFNEENPFENANANNARTTSQLSLIAASPQVSSNNLLSDTDVIDLVNWFQVMLVDSTVDQENPCPP